MRLVQKILIKHNKNQKETFDFWLRRCKTLYNTALEQRIESYNKLQVSINYFDQKKELPLLKIEDESWKDIPNKSLSETLERLDKAFKKFFKEHKTNGVGFPKYKNNDNFKSVYFVKTDIKIVDNKHIKLPKIKQNIVLNEELKDINLQFTSVNLIKESDNKYYLVFNYEDNKEPICYDYENDINLKSIGIDLGLKTLSTDSDGYKINRFSSKLVKKYTDRIVELNQSLSKTVKGSKNRKKVKKQLSKAHRRLKNTRVDYQNKEVKKYVDKMIVDEVKCVALGDIKVKDIITKKDKPKDNSKPTKPIKSKRFLRRSFNNNGLSEFKVKLINKCESKGIKVYKVKENYTSKTCSCCGLVDDKLKLSDRVFNCKNCKISVDRDVNGSINIKAVWQGQFKPYRLDSQMEKRFVSL